MVTFTNISFYMGDLLGLPMISPPVFTVAYGPDDPEMLVAEYFIPRQIGGVRIYRDDNRFWIGNCYGEITAFSEAQQMYITRVKLAGAKR